jgi:Protein of unknown function (DUF3999)
MNRFRCAGLFLLVLGGLPSAYGQETAGPGAGEPLSAWQWYEEVRWPQPAPAQHVDFLLTPTVFDKARADLADLRLYDTSGREVPYALRIRRTEHRQEPLSAREFNRTKNPDRSVEVSLDLGPNPGEHNEIDIGSTGDDYRRQVRLEGSDTQKEWRTLLDHGEIVHFQVGSQVVDVHRLRYPVSRFRYLRLRVLPDRSKEKDDPALASVVVYHSVEMPGEYLTQAANLGTREPVRIDEGPPGSAWNIEFGGLPAYCEQISIDAAEKDFARPYRLEMANPNEPRQPLAGGEWRRQAGARPQPLEVRFPEVLARRLQLTVTDFRNPPLTLTGVRYTAPVRQVIFPAAEVKPPLRLYFGNPNAQPPHYDFAANLPPQVDPPPLRTALEALVENPVYRPVPKPWSERWPWLVYLVLGLAGVVLLGILAALAREAIRRRDAALAGTETARRR